MIDETLVQKIRNRREQKDWSQMKLANEAGVSLKTVQRAENDENVKQQNLENILQRLFNRIPLKIINKEWDENGWLITQLKIYILNSGSLKILRNKEREFIIVRYEKPEKQEKPSRDFMEDDFKELEDDIPPF